MPKKDIMNCFEPNSTINIADTGGELIEGLSQITALAGGINLKCDELIETADDGSYEDGATPTSITGNNRIVFTKTHKVYCGEFIEN